MLEWAGQYGSVTEVTGGSKALFAATSYYSNQGSSQGSAELYPIIDWTEAKYVLVQGGATAQAAIGGNSMTSSAGLVMQFGNSGITLVQAQAEEHHDINIPSQTKSASWTYTIVRQGSQWALYEGIGGSELLAPLALTASPLLVFQAWASTQQHGSTASVTGSIDVRLILYEGSQPVIPLPISPTTPETPQETPQFPNAQMPTLSASGIGIAAAGLALLFMMKKRRKK